MITLWATNGACTKTGWGADIPHWQLKYCGKANKYFMSSGVYYSMSGRWYFSNDYPISLEEMIELRRKLDRAIMNLRQSQEKRQVREELSNSIYWQG